MEKEVVSVLKYREAMVRNMVEKKKCIIVYCIKEEKKKTVQAQSFETSKVKNILRSMNNQEEKKLEEEVDKITIDWGNMGKEKTDH